MSILESNALFYDENRTQHFHKANANMGCAVAQQRRLLYFRRRHDNDAERISEISVAPTAGEILCERPPYVPRNSPSTWEGMNHLKVR